MEPCEGLSTRGALHRLSWKSWLTSTTMPRRMQRQSSHNPVDVPFMAVVLAIQRAPGKLTWKNFATKSKNGVKNSEIVSAKVERSNALPAAEAAAGPTLHKDLAISAVTSPVLRNANVRDSSPSSPG